MAITPDTDLYLIKCPIESDQRNQLTFATRSAQETYFKGLPKISFEDFSYQRKDSYIRIPAHIDDIIGYNYVMYRNNNYSNKWFYAFITNMEYQSDKCTYVYIKTDVYQTWAMDITTKASFVEREHVSDDTIGIHTLPEEVETGDYVDQNPDLPDNGGTAQSIQLNDYVIDDKYVVLGVSELVIDAAAPAPQYNGVFSGLYYIAFPSFQDCRKYISYVQTKVSSDPITVAFMAPEALVTLTGFTWHTYTQDGQNFQYGFIPSYAQAVELENVEITKPTYLDNNYVPRNKKLLTYPYHYFAISNNAGTSNVYKYEFFPDTVCRFSLKGTIDPGCSIQLIPIAYGALGSDFNFTFENYMEAIDAAKFPTCGWTNDAYTNWLTQNAINLPLEFVDSATKIAGGIGLTLTGAGAGIGVGSMLAGIGGIASSIGEIYSHSTIPTTAKGGANQGNLQYASKRGFTLYKKSIRIEYARIIDKYFDMYGYKVNTVKIPNYTGRTNWNFVKTIGLNCYGDVPEKDLQEYKDMFNNGVTLWHNPSTFMDYTQNNNIIGG